MIKKIAVLVTCHNRKDTTLACLDALYKNKLPKNYQLDCFLVDDGSTDGTSEAISKQFPSVEIIQGDGSLFWAGGMRVAFSAAIEKNYDYYLWLNDDSILNDTCLSQLIECNKQHISKQGVESIIVGAMADPITGKLTYSGIRRKKRLFNQISMERIQLLNNQAVKADTMNGNCVLIPDSAVQKLGNIDSAFSHALGDYDYGLRASKLGIEIWVTPHIVGSCAYDHVVKGSYNDINLSLKVRFKKLISIKGLPPYAWMVYCRRHAGFMWPFIWCNRYIRVLLSSIFH